MELAQFLHIETRKCSWFAHWWMKQHHKDPENYPLDMSLTDWAEEFYTWEAKGCPNPNNPGVLYWYEDA